MSYCESIEEKACFEKLRNKFPTTPIFMLDLMSWVFVNKPERFEEIMTEHQNNMDTNLVELKDIDYKMFLKNAKDN